MDLRTITIGIPLNNISNLEIIEQNLQRFLDRIKIEFSKYEISIRTFRINLTPLTEEIISNIDNQHEIMGKLNSVEKMCERLGVRWFNVPFDLSEGENNIPSLMDFALNLFRRSPKIFTNLIISKDDTINFSSIKYASKFIKDVSTLDNSGYNNFRVGVSCNVKPNTPFFPFTFSSNEVGFSVGLELPKELVKIIDSFPNKDLNSIRNELIEKLPHKIKKIETICKQISAETLLNFHGIDFSLAPYPETDSSVAILLERLGLERQGSNGTLFLTSYLTDILREIIKKGEIKNTGFNGVMFSLLEDEFMCKRNNADIYSIDSLISYSSVCGCGLDMVPLPGDIFEEELSSIILDVAALSIVLKKPLGVRVLPIPRKHENEFTEFNMDFLFNTRIKKLKNLAMSGDYMQNIKFKYLFDNGKN
jgi:uncharacterized protein (UPF0210 family)